MYNWQGLEPSTYDEKQKEFDSISYAFEVMRSMHNWQDLEHSISIFKKERI